MVASTNLVVELGIVFCRVDGLAVRGERVLSVGYHDRAALARRRFLAEGEACVEARQRLTGESWLRTMITHHPRASQLQHEPWSKKPCVPGVGGPMPPPTPWRISRCGAESWDRLWSGRIPGSRGAHSGVERGLHPRPRRLDDARERRGRPAHRACQLRLLDRNVPLAAALWKGESRLAEWSRSSSQT